MSSQTQRRRLQIEQIGQVTVVSLTNRKLLVEESIQAVGEDLFRLVEQSGRTKLLLNFSNVEHMSSAVLGMLVRLNKKVLVSGGKLALCGIDPQIREVFEITKLDKVFSIHSDEQEALQTF
jgi:anti-sigma B factor antagonist